MHDVIVVGAGFGGLVCAAKLARAGRRVLVLEKCPHIGGTSYVFRRGGYTFPMGPLAFSFPQRVRALLEEAGVQEEITFSRNHFGLRTPAIQITYSNPLGELEEKLGKIFPEERPGIRAVLSEMRRIIEVARDLDLWYPDFLPGRCSGGTDNSAEKADKVDFIKSLSETPASCLLKKYLSDPVLINLLGSMGASEPAMSLLNFGFMWNMMSGVGIWSPSCGIHGLADFLLEAFRRAGGEIEPATAVKEIIIEGGKAAGVRTARGIFKAGWVVSNADYKTTFLDLILPDRISPGHLEQVRAIPYTGSEFCVYLGIDPRRVDLSAVGVEHLFYQKEISRAGVPGPDDFNGREIEICRWSMHSPWSVPERRESLILRTGFSHDDFSFWRTGEKQRKEGYREMKQNLALKLIRTLEDLIPGVESSIEVMEIATPLTYQDWGNRRQGSIAGWTWTPGGGENFPGKLLVRTPVDHLLAAGIYAAKDLYLGGVPTAMQTGALAARYILET